MHLSDAFAVLSNLNPILLVAIGIGFLIFVHEVGHFLAAKWVGVRVEAFSLGFGPVILHHKVGQTDYRLSLIPLGGYVKLAGESREGGREPRPDELWARSVGERALVFIAGVAMNFLFAFLMFILAFRIGVSFIAANVGGVEPGSPAWVAGLQPGDRIISINGEPDPDFEELINATALDSGNKGVSLTIVRDGQQLHYRLMPEYDPDFGIRQLGIESAATLRVNAIYAYKNKTDSPALRAGIKVGDRILAVNNQKLKSWPEFVAICRASPEKPLTVLLDREGKQVSVTLVPRRVAPYQIGLSGMSSAIWAVRKGTLAEQLGLAKGDRIASVNETPVASWMRFVETLGQTKESPVRIGLEHDQTTRTVSLESATDALKARFLEGVASRQSLVMAEVVEGSPAAKAGLKPGDRILTLDGRKLRTWDEFAALVRGSEGKPVALTWQREGKRFGPVLIRPVANEKAAYGEVGLEAMKDRVLRKYGFWKSCTVGTHKAVLAVVRLYYTLVGFASGTISPRHVGSIILIAQASYYSALEGLGTLLYFLGIVGINLAIINLFPIPILDGGHLLFLLFEKIKGSPVKERTMAIAQYAGLVVLLGLVLYAVRNDILRIFGSS